MDDNQVEFFLFIRKMVMLGMQASVVRKSLMASKSTRLNLYRRRFKMAPWTPILHTPDARSLLRGRIKTAALAR